MLTLSDELLSEARGNLDVHVAFFGDAGVPYGRRVETLDICHTSGLRQVVLTVRPDGAILKLSTERERLDRKAAPW